MDKPHSASPLARCFLCEPEPHLTWDSSPHFRAVLGIGPIGEGFTLIAAREHVPSMFDLEDSVASELDDFTATVRNRLAEVYGPSIVTEHGRVAPCIGPAVRRHEPHCLHAHRLVFPGVARLDLAAAAPWLQTHRFDSYQVARAELGWAGQYVYVEQLDGACQVARVTGPLPRQFLRSVVATSLGRPEIADWRRHPGHETVDAARLALATAA